MIVPGDYYIVYRVNIPSGIAVSTTLSLQVNNSNLPGTTSVINKAASSPADHINVDTIASLSAFSSVRLSSSSVISIASTNPSEILGSLTFIKLN